jgi:hypothetical protein
MNALTRGAYLTGGNTTFDGSATSTWTVDATSANTASKVVARDASGNFSAGTITATRVLGVDYTDVINKPTIPASQINADWNATTGVAQILNKPILSSSASAKVQVFVASGTFTVPTGVTSLKVTVVGGGGSGGGRSDSATYVGGCGGGGGGAAIKWITGITSGTAITVTIGAGGLPCSATAPANGLVGGTSSFGTYCSATGGSGGGYGNNLVLISQQGGGAGGIGTGGDLNIKGGGGALGSSAFCKGGGSGGSSILGGGAQSTLISSSGGQSGSGTGGFAGGSYGGGGGGAYASTVSASTSRVSGAGASGVVIVEWL